MRVLALACIVVGVTTALETRSNTQACPLLGQEYPPPVHIKDEPDLQAAGRSLDATLNEKVSHAEYGDATFSLGLFSTTDDDLVYQYHHTGPRVANSSYGTNKVDANSIYRIGSISKLLTMYTWLIQDGDRHFTNPVTDFLPQLLKYKAESWNSLTPDWKDIEIGDLAGQMAGLARDYGLADLALKTNGLLKLPPSLLKGLPNVPTNQLPICGYEELNGTWLTCTEDQYLSGLANESPIFAPAYTPVYSNEAFATLGLALSSITGSSMEAMFNESLVKTLGLKSTSYTVPSEITDNDVIPVNPLKSGWNAEFGLFGPAGGYFSSTNDFMTLGKSMLTSRLLPTALTRRWMKPSSFVEAWDAGVGRPWEIFRMKVNGQSVDIYSKSGDWGAYHSTLALIPTYNIGFSSFIAGNEKVRNEVPNVVIDAIMPALDKIARAQASSRFAGHYVSTKTNSSITITTNGAESGLKVTQWVNNGASLMNLFNALVPDLVYRILPNQLYDDKDHVGFTSFYEGAAAPAAKGHPFFQCPSWFDVDELTYGNIPFGQMTFTVDSSGKASAVELRAFQETLERQS